MLGPWMYLLKSSTKFYDERTGSSLGIYSDEHFGWEAEGYNSKAKKIMYIMYMV
jgi:hypothetical protein